MAICMQLHCDREWETSIGEELSVLSGLVVVSRASIMFFDNNCKAFNTSVVVRRTYDEVTILITVYS